MSGLLNMITNPRGRGSSPGGEDRAPEGSEASETSILSVTFFALGGVGCAFFRSTMAIHVPDNVDNTAPISDENEGSIILSLISQLR